MIHARPVRAWPLAMHTIKPASLKPGAAVAPAQDAVQHDQDSTRNVTAGAAPTGDTPRLIRGRALIVWDPKVPGKKRDAIDTDQITPAADCVSESLELLDERWKVGRLPSPDSRFPRARPSRRDVPDCRRPLRDRLLPRDEPRGPEGRRRGSGARAGGGLRPSDGRHLPAQLLQPWPARARMSRSGGRCPGRRHAHVRPVDACARERNTGPDVSAGAARAEGRRDPPRRRHLRGRTTGAAAIDRAHAAHHLAG